MKAVLTAGISAYGANGIVSPRRHFIDLAFTGLFTEPSAFERPRMASRVH
jgi:hypothetical protein